MRGSCSQEGEDILLERLDLLPSIGTYIDVGAGHPYRWSNTARLYRKGWHGTLVEPNPALVTLLRRWRRRDDVIQAVVGSPGQSGIMAAYDDSNYNTIDQELVAERAMRGLKPAYQIEARVETLATIQALNEARFNDRVNLISVDTEGNDLSVLQSGDWEGRLRPQVVVAEILGVGNIRALLDNPLVRFMESQTSFSCPGSKSRHCSWNECLSITTTIAGDSGTSGLGVMCVEGAC